MDEEEEIEAHSIMMSRVVI